MPRKTSQFAVAGSRNTSVDVLLAEDVPNLGQQGDIVRVKPGYARNYLLPQGMAAIATDHNKRMVEQHKIKVEALQAERLKQLKELASNVQKYSVTIEENANKEGHLYGSVVATDISKSLKSAGYDISPEQIKLEGPLKELGMYTVAIELHAKVTTEVKVWVVPAASA